MSVLYVTETPIGDGGSETVGSEIKYTRAFHIRVDNPLDTISLIAQHPDIPARWSPHPDNPKSLAQEYTWERPTKGARLWKLEIGYSSRPLGGGLQNMSREFTPEQQENPLQRPAKINWDPVAYRAHVTMMRLVQNADPRNIPAPDAQIQMSVTTWGLSAGGKPITLCNSAGEIFQNTQEVDDSRQQITVEKNIASPQIWMLNFRNKVNNAAFALDGVNMPAGTVKCSGIRIGDVQFENDIVYRTMRVEMFHNPEGWDFFFPDNGFEEMDVSVSPNLDGTRKRKKMPNDDTTTATVRQRLNGFGFKATTPDQFYITYRHYEQVSFSQLIPYLT